MKTSRILVSMASVAFLSACGGSSSGGASNSDGHSASGGGSGIGGGNANPGSSGTTASATGGSVAVTGAATSTTTSNSTSTSTAVGGSSSGGRTTAAGAPSATAGAAGGGGQLVAGAAAWAPSSACVQKAAALAASLTLAQRIGQMTQVDSGNLTTDLAATSYLGSVLSGGGTDPPAGNTIADWSTLISSYLQVGKGLNPHLGMLYGLDSIHGNNNVMDAVIFPHNIGLGATRNAQLVEDAARITAQEMLGVGANWAFAPTVAAALDERWGRTYEAFSETPELAGELGAATIRGLQNGKLGNAQSVLACAKHFAGDGATDGGKNSGNVTQLDETTFRKVAIDPYRSAIAAGLGSIMVSYSSYQGTKLTGAKYWLSDVLKGELGFQGFLVSDWDAVSMLPGNFSEQVKTAINAGLDMVMLSNNSFAHTPAELASTLTTLVNAGDVTADRIEDAVRRILAIKCEMDLLDGDTTIDPALTAAIGSTEHRAIAREAVRQSLVLLKNDGAFLPMPQSLTRIHVTGSGADSLAKQCGGWTIGWQGLGTSGPATNTTAGTTVLGAIKHRLAGSATSITSSSDGSGAAGADRAIVVVGEAPYAEGNGDKANPTLTAADFSAIAAVKAANVPFAVILFSGRPLILTDANGASAIDQANAFIAAWLPGSEGDGIADVLFGDAKPVGKLSFSWPANLSQIPINVGDGKTPLFAFGYGLTYP